MTIIGPAVWTQDKDGILRTRHYGTPARVDRQGDNWYWTVGRHGRDDFRAGKARTRDQALQAAEEELYNR